jgi:hypothetical protein
LSRNEPQVHYVPRIIEYLGYTPLFDLAGTSLGKRIGQQLFVNGLTQREFAKHVDVDPLTISRIVEEKGVRLFDKRMQKLSAII